MHPEGRRVQPVSLGSLGLALGAVGFIWGRWVHWCAPWGQSGSSGVAWPSRLHPWGRRVHSGSQGSLECAFGVVGFIQDRWVHWGTPWGSWCSPWFTVFTGCVGHPVSLGTLGAPWVPSGSSGVTGFTGVHPGFRRVHPGSLGSLRCALR